MSDVHLSRELLTAVFGCERDPRDLIPLVLGHLLDRCQKCAETFRTWKQEIPTSATLSYDEIATTAIEKTCLLLDRIREQELAATAILENLLASPLESRQDLIDRAPKDAKSPALANGLIDAARDALPDNPRESRALAQLARTVLQHAELSPFVSELYARAVAYVGNALRVLGSLPEAVEVMAHARFILRQEGGGDRLIRSELDNLEGLVRLHQRDYSEAEMLLKRAIMGFSSAGLQREMLRSKMNLAVVFDYSGELDSCIRIQREVVNELHAWKDESKLVWFARHNLTVSLAVAEHYDEAARLLEANRGFLAPGETYAQMKFSWLEGMIAQGLGDLDAAESHFSTARYGFKKLGLPFDTAFVSLDLACVYLAQYRPGDVKALAGELVQTFEKQERHGETLAAVLLFRAAAELERVTLDFVRELTGYLRQSALDPHYKFTQRVDRRC